MKARAMAFDLGRDERQPNENSCSVCGRLGGCLWPLSMALHCCDCASSSGDMPVTPPGAVLCPACASAAAAYAAFVVEQDGGGVPLLCLEEIAAAVCDVRAVPKRARRDILRRLDAGEYGKVCRCPACEDDRRSVPAVVVGGLKAPALCDCPACRQFRARLQ